MINKKIILKILGLLILIEGIFLLISSFVALFYQQNDDVALFISAGICFFSGGIAWLFTRNANENIGKREGYIIVSIVWVVFSLFGALPFVINGAIPSYTDAFSKPCQVLQLQVHLF